MVWLYPLLVLTPASLLLLAGNIPSRWANRHPSLTRRCVMLLSLAVLCLAVLNAVALAMIGPLNVTLVRSQLLVPLSLSLCFDNLAAIMLLLVSFIGCIIVRYSLRYLDGEPKQGAFMSWISFTLGAVLLLIVSGNLVMFMGAWVLTSFGLHQLLTYYADRPAAMLAARKKFLISRLGDALLLVAVVLTYYVFGSSEYSEIFAAAKAIQANQSQGSWLLPVIGTLLVVGAMTKSAQFPFHSWLPDTMETPTPVSALMHAGIINAGGFLVIRLSPLISLSHSALDLLAVMGAVTALFGAVVMLTQTSVKRSLAYSTMAQMGFMMLQCGVGAYVGAMLHIVAHSLYKAHAFLSSGSVLDTVSATRSVATSASGTQQDHADLGTLVWRWLTLALLTITSLLAVTWVVASMNHNVLAWILVIALAHLLWKSVLTGRRQVMMAGLLTVLGVSASYYLAYGMMHAALADSLPHAIVSPSLFDHLLLWLVGGGFLAVFLLQLGVARFNHTRFFQSLYVHASNGFYFDIAAQRITLSLWR